MLLVMDAPVPLMHHDPDRSWITDPIQITPKERTLNVFFESTDQSFCETEVD